ncbi:hypothetical protein bcere0009_54970 [Bacillus cereus R309803]|nr:hypothetical protein bcere0009_54970 [Bacillus cereus R309803]
MSFEENVVKKCPGIVNNKTKKNPIGHSLLFTHKLIMKLALLLM